MTADPSAAARHRCRHVLEILGISAGFPRSTTACRLLRYALSSSAAGTLSAAATAFPAPS
jgi:hypothetical protein